MHHHHISRPESVERHLSLTPNGNVRCQLKTSYRDGATLVIFEPLDFIARLAALPAWMHSFRKTLVRLGETACRSPEEFKAWSQNLGHEGVLMRFYSYGEVQPTRQSEIFKAVQSHRNHTRGQNVDEFAAAIVKAMRAQACVMFSLRRRIAPECR